MTHTDSNARTGRSRRADARCARQPQSQRQTIAITGGKVYPVSGPPIENGTVVITRRKIVAVGRERRRSRRRAAHRRDRQDG